MIQIKMGLCKECVKEGYTREVPIVNRTHKLCLKHNRLRLNSQREVPKNYGNQRFSQTYSYCTDWGFTKEIEMFRFIFDDRPHVSEFTGLAIDDSPSSFLHVLPKGLGKYPNFRFNPDNIWLGTKYEHFLIDHGNDSLRKNYAKKYPQFKITLQVYRAKEAQLKEDYKQRFKS